ncbi:MAG: anti-sigma factor, partial [Alphaproteobacteria bacterium]
MIPHRHPPEDVLLSYAAGGLPEPVALLVATHLTLCPPCRAQCDDFVTLGGVILEGTAGDPVSSQCLERTLARLDAEDERPADPTAPPAFPSASLPQPLARYLPGARPSLPWRRIGNRIAEIRLLRRYPGFTTRLVRVTEGTRIVRHSHDGLELTLVLAGGYSCGSEPFRAGDF